MKALFLSTALLLTLPALAQTIEAREAKAEMLERAERIEKSALDGRKFFKDGKLAEGCGEVEYIYKRAGDHVDGLMGNLDFSKKKVAKAQDQSLELLRLIHQMERTCNEEKDFKQVDPELFAERLKRVARDAKRHRKLIRKQEVRPEQNSYHYRYEY